jgi:hypothetical protein
MGRRKRGTDRIKVGRVNIYLHHGAWWIYFSETISLHVRGCWVVDQLLSKS